MRTITGQLRRTPLPRAGHRAPLAAALSRLRQIMTRVLPTTVASATMRAKTPAKHLAALPTMAPVTMVGLGVNMRSAPLARTAKTVALERARCLAGRLRRRCRRRHCLRPHRAQTCMALRVAPALAATRMCTTIFVRTVRMRVAGIARGASLPIGQMQKMCMRVSLAAPAGVVLCRGKAASVCMPLTLTLRPQLATRAVSSSTEAAPIHERVTTSRQPHTMAATVCLKPSWSAARTRQQLTSTPRLHAAAHARIRFADALTRGHAIIHRRARSTTAAAASSSVAAWMLPPPILTREPPSTRAACTPL